MITSKDLYDQINESQLSNIHGEAYLETSEVLLDFLNEGKQQNEIHWVCNSAPGQGKTTALKALAKMLIVKRDSTPFLMVFNNKDTMNNFYEEISEYSLEKQRPFLIQYLNEDNLDRVYDEVDQYQVLCITQQRLRDLHLGYGDSYKILNKVTDGRKNEGRLIIIDEMPIYSNDTDFDISSENNSVDWFDHLASVNNLDISERQFARILINDLISKEMTSGNPSTHKLINHIKDTEAELRFMKILQNLSTEVANREHSLKYRWFMKLLVTDNIGVLDEQIRGYIILCSEIIDYRSFGNILILDGTSHITPSFYKGYEFKLVKNYHDYQSRLHIHHRQISTSVRNRTPETVQFISNDIFKLRETNGEIFPLMMKNDICKYIASGAIAEDQKKYFEKMDSPNEGEGLGNEMPLNLLNTVGKNVLGEFNSLALLNLPIRHPSSYKKSAIAVLGTEVNIKLNDGNFTSWFEDEEVQMIHEEMFMADIIQLIHRCSLRKINQDTPIHIFIYTNQKRWIDKLQEYFGLSDSNVTSYKLKDDDLGKFLKECDKWASKSLQHCQELQTYLNNPFGVAVYASKIGGSSFKEWLKRHWKDEIKKAKILEIFEENELRITVSKSGFKKIEYAG